jgi:hypothetical protein
MKKPKTLGTAPTKAPEEWIAEKDEAKFKENAGLKRDLTTVRAALQDAEGRAKIAEKELGLLRKIDSVRLAPPEWLTPKASGTGHRAIPTLDLGDFHWGEVVDPAQVQGVNCYNVRISKLRCHKAFEQAVVLARDYLQGVSYEGIEVVLGGDIVSGNIQDLRESNEEMALESVFGSAEHITAGLKLLAKDFKRVHVTAVVGNHGRSTKKTIYKNRVRDSLDWAVYRAIQLHLGEKSPVQMTIADGASERLTVYGTSFVVNHGEDFHGGSGISAELAPLLLALHRLVKREMSLGRPFNAMVTHHRHRYLPMFQLGVSLNGSLVGYSELAQNAVLNYELPTQAFWLNTPEHGVSAVMPVYVQDRAAEGW